MDKIKLDRNLFEVMEKITKEGKKKENLEKILRAYVFGYEEEEEEEDKYTIVLFEEDGFKSVLWELHGGYEISEEHDYVEMEGFKKTFTKPEILNKFPKLWPLAQKNK